MHSFDVFDTLLTRTTATPKGIFALMQQELQNSMVYQDISDYIKDNFYFLRMNAEMMANSYSHLKEIEEITLEQIYDALAMSGSVSPKEKKLLIELERKTEIDNSIGITENIEKVKSLVARDKHIALISDMYMDKDTIQSMLVKADPIFKNIKLYVSSEVKKCKWSGNLFRYVKECEKIEDSEWIHMGDNIHVDVNVAKSIGIHTEHYNFEKFTPYEKEILDKKEDDAFVQLMIGAARNTRLLNCVTDAFNIGCSLGGTILFPYVWWLLQQSIKRKIHRLYFVARDGYILKKIADIIINQYQYDISTFYIYGSRRAWRMISLSERNHDIESIIKGSYLNSVSSISELAEVFLLSESELREIFPLLKRVNPDQVSLPIIKAYIKKEIQLHKFDFIKVLNAKHKDKRNLTIDYLKQEIDYSDDDFAFVELAGSGLTQGCLAEMLQDFYNKPIQTFFFKLDFVNTPENCIFYVYIPSYMYLNVIIEMLARAPHGQTIGYKKNNEKIEPVFNEWEEQALIDHGFYDYLKGIISFTHIYLNTVNFNFINFDKINLINSYMNYITRTPDKDVLEFIGGMPNSVTGRERKVTEYAPVLTNQDLRNIYLIRMEEPLEKYYHGTAIEYSILRSGPKAVKKIDFYNKNYSRLLGKIARSKKKKKTNYKDYEHLFLYEVLFGRIAIYAAGKVGQAIYKGIKSNTTCNVVQWVDAKYDEYRKKGLPVSSPDEIGTVFFDQIIIALLSEQQSDCIREKLLKKGIAADKIIWMNLRAR